MICSLLCLSVLSITGCKENMAKKYPDTLRTAYMEHFDIGCGFKTSDVEKFTEEQFKDFSTITAEYEMKWAYVQPTSAVSFSWDSCDKLAELCRTQDKKLRVHTLVWHSDDSIPTWVKRRLNTLDDDEKLPYLKECIVTFYENLYERYSDIIVEVDVANELLSDNPQYESLRTNSIYYEAAGSNQRVIDFVADIFKEVKRISPDVTRVYNDYRIIANTYKRTHCVQLVKDLNAAGADVQVIGLQSHVYINEVTKDDLRDTFDAFLEIPNLKIAMTEIDVSLYIRELNYSGNPEPEKEMTDELQQELSNTYDIMFSVAREYSEYITNVTLWGATDYQHSKDTAIEGRNDHPTLFDDEGKQKPAYFIVRDYKE